MKEETIEIFRTFSHPMRMQMMELLAQKPHTVDQLTEKLPLQRATVNTHLVVLRSAGLLESTDEGRPVYYHVDRNVLGRAIRDFAKGTRIELSKPAKKAKAKRS